MKYGEAFVYVAKDNRWVQKLLLGGLIGIVPVLNFALFGYMVEIARNIRSRIEPVLPEWSRDFGRKFVDGFFLWAIGVIYMVPIFLFIAPLWVIFAALMISLGEKGSSFSAVQGVLTVFLILAAVICGIIAVLYGLAFSFASVGIYARFISERRFGAAFQIKHVIAFIRSRLRDYLAVWGITLGLGFAVGLVSGMVSAVFSVVAAVPFVGWCLSIFLVPASVYVTTCMSDYMTFVEGNLIGQLMLVSA